MPLFLELIRAHLCILIIIKTILCEGLAEGLDASTSIAEAIYPINFTQPNERFKSTL